MLRAQRILPAGWQAAAHWVPCLLFGLCSCTSLETGKVAQSEATRPPLVTIAPPASARLEEPETAAAPGRVQFNSPINSPIQQTSFQGEPLAEDDLCEAIEVYPHAPRLPPLCPPGAPPFVGGMVVDCETSSPLLYPDEYLYDGGDRAQPIHYNEYGMLGLETEDTVVEYKDELGINHVRKSNRVAVYAPRFGSLTSVSAPAADVQFNQVAGADSSVRGSGIGTRVTAALHGQRVGTERVQTRLRASGLETQAQLQDIVQEQRLTIHFDAIKLLENANLDKDITLLTTAEAQLALSLQAAENWTRTENPVISGQVESGGEAIVISQAAQFVGLEPKSNKPGVLKLFKTADKQTALQGEIVTFTILYENIGDRPLDQIVISDNLTPRLSYVEDSATSTRDGRLIVEDNGEGSVILRWELEQPLPGKEGGVVTFEARVN